MLWGLIIAGVIIAAIAAVVITRTKSATDRATDARRKRFAIPDTGERVPLATPPPARPETTSALISDQTPSFTATPVTTPARRVSGRLVDTPEGEMVLTTPPFALRGSMFSTKAGRFINLLSRRTPAWVMLCPKVRLDALLTPTRPDGRDPADWRDWRRRVRVRAVDIVLCDRRTWRPLVAILIDAASPSPTRIGGGTDRMIDEVLAAAGLPLLRLSGDFEQDWPVVRPYVEEAILPHVPDQIALEADTQMERVSEDGAVALLRLDQEKGWMLE